MSRRDDLEARIRKSYDIIRGYEEIAQVSDRPEEVQRARRQIEEQWQRIRQPLVEYLALSRRRTLPVPEDIAEIVATLDPELEEEATRYRAPAFFVPLKQNWTYGIVAIAVVLIVGIIVLLIRPWRSATTPEPSLTPTLLPPTETATATVTVTPTTATATVTPAPSTPTPTATPIFNQHTLY